MLDCLAILLSVFRIIVIPAQFEDREFTYAQKDLRATVEAAQSYLDEQFLGTVEFSFGITEPITLKHNLQYYGTNRGSGHDTYIFEAVMDACKAVNSDVDFSGYDGDGDGRVDCIVLMTPGYSEADTGTYDMIWPQQDWLRIHSQTLVLDGTVLDGFVVVTELKEGSNGKPKLAGHGDLCHEIMHIFGLPDFYDVDGENSGLVKAFWGSTSLMDRGNRNDYGFSPPNFNSLEMDLLGLGTCDTLSKGSHILYPLDKDHRYLKAGTDREGEFYLFECRGASGRDSSIGGEGLLIYHIDMTDKEAWENNVLNSDISHPCAYLVEAIPDAQDISGVFFPQEGATDFSSDSQPAFSFWSGSRSRLAITGIHRNLDGSIGFNVSEPVRINSLTAFQDAVIVTWSLEGIKGLKSMEVTWFKNGEEVGSSTVDGAGAYTIEHLMPQTEYQLRVSVTDNDDRTFSVMESVRTKAYVKDVHPFIFLSDEDRNEDGSFIQGARIPLRVFNVPDSERTEWYFDNVRIVPGHDSRFTLHNSGTLKAIVFQSNGSTDIIIKEIVVL